jgi:hypothetical protein
VVVVIADPNILGAHQARKCIRNQHLEVREDGRGINMLGRNINGPSRRNLRRRKPIDRPNISGLTARYFCSQSSIYTSCTLSIVFDLSHC